jgi:hypothetical protein
VEIVERSTIVAAIHSGELYWSKVEISAPVKDDAAYTSLMDQAANGELSASKLRKRVRLEASKEDEAEDVKDEPPRRGGGVPKKPRPRRVVARPPRCFYTISLSSPTY